MSNSTLDTYIQSARAKNISDDVIKTQLINSGWSENQVVEALSLKTSDDLLPSVPAPNFGMWVTFEYIILFITLYVSFTCLSGIISYAIDKYIPDLPSSINIYSSSYSVILMQGYLAGVIVTYPIFAILFVILKKQAIANPLVNHLSARKMLIYITLIATFLIIIYELTTVIYGFISGGSTLNSFAHFCAAIFIAGTIFIYLILQVWEDKKIK